MPLTPESSSLVSGMAQRPMPTIQSEWTAVAIRPRASPGRGGASTKGEIVITLDLVKTLFDKPIVEAAKIVGISLSAFKRSCRSLGILAWPYRFQTNSNSLLSPAAEAKPLSQTVQAATHPQNIVFPTVGCDPQDEAERKELVRLLECSKKIWSSVPSAASTNCLELSFDLPSRVHPEWIVAPLENSSDPLGDLQSME
eukprot:CAMPEP_0196757784 /NCGR_PEP_ID=MMETSP1091-20130531/103843_1 /TAXON_ID=302021 /ORGANISM="Rhodomonas sp., Strain CCMP768" /LENGTH=197 /DNA_ID=CAMNT_0042106569 /DNA_START=38 /DNA_END=631 /DNA_ORIENTATION=+